MKALIASLIILVPVLGFASDNPDHGFLKNAAEGGLSEVELGHLAQEQGSSQAVKDYGAMMVRDHLVANRKLQTLAESKKVELPSDTTLMHKVWKKALSLKSGADFDEGYIEGQIEAHEDTLALLKKEIETGEDADTKAFAASILPKVEEHLALINRIAAQEGVEVER